MARWKEAHEVREIAERLIPEHHQHLELRMDEIRYVFRNEASTSNGRTVMGKARKIGGLNCYLAHATPDELNDFDDDTPRDMFVMEIAHDEWETLTQEGKVALVDHELEHFDVTETDTGKLRRALRGHDVEEFHVILKRHGLWKADLRTFAEQLKMPGVAG